MSILGGFPPRGGGVGKGAASQQSEVIAITEREFESEVIQSDMPVLIGIVSARSSVCRQIAPEVEAFARDVVGKIKVVSIDVDESPNIVRELRIQQVPTFILFAEKRIADAAAGPVTKKQLQAMVDPYMPRAAGAVKPAELAQFLAAGVFVPIDTREAAAFKRAHLPHSRSDSPISKRSREGPSSIVAPVTNRKTRHGGSASKGFRSRTSKAACSRGKPNRSRSNAGDLQAKGRARKARLDARATCASNSRVSYVKSSAFSLLFAFSSVLALGGCSASSDESTADSTSEHLSGKIVTVDFAGDFTTSTTGTLAVGETAKIAYDASRLTTCRGDANDGSPGCTVSAFYRVNGGPIASVTVAGHVADPSETPTFPLTTAGDLEIWFQNTSMWGCSAYDSAYGANYHFTIVASATAPYRIAILAHR